MQEQTVRIRSPHRSSIGCRRAWPLDGVLAASYPHAVVGVLTNNHLDLPLDGVLAASNHWLILP